MRLITLLLAFLLLNSPALAQEKQDFDSWLEALKSEAAAKGIKQEVIDEAFADVTAPSEDVIERDQKQPEKVQLFSEYLQAVVNQRRVKAGRREAEDNAKLLRKVSAKYHVPSSILVSLWAIESNFGKNQGDYSIIEALITLAYDGRRSELFRKELINALKILQTEDMAPEDLTGSWAGAMGQTQFMPSSYLNFAVDFDDDGSKDIWTSDADALASIANYLHSKGWNPKAGWGMKVLLPESEPDFELWRGEKLVKSLKEWNELGFMREDGKPLPKTKQSARLVIPEDGSAVFLVFPNYDILMDWNRSIYFATSVCLLADQIGKK